MRLVRFNLNDFQSYQTLQEVRFEADVTLLAGRNNVGKTALLRALQLVTNPEPGAGPSRLPKFTWDIPAAQFTTRVHLVGVSVLEPSLQKIATDGSCELVLELRALGSAAESRALGFPATSSPSVGGGDAPLEIARLAVTEQTKHRCDRNESNGNAVQLWWDNSRLESNQDTAGVISQLHTLVVDAFQSMFYVHPRRRSQPGTFHAISLALDPDAGNITTVVATLYNNSRYDLWPQLEDFMTDVFPEIRNVEVRMLPVSQPPTAEIDLRYGRADGLSVPLRFSGTGVEQVLTLATAILTAAPDRCFLIDEPHAYLYPAAERGLLRLLRKHPEQKRAKTNRRFGGSRTRVTAVRNHRNTHLSSG